MILAMRILQRLAAARGGEAEAPYVSGAALAAEAGVTRSAVWKAIEQLRGLGAEIEAVTHRGYRLRGAASPLDTAGVIAALAPATRARLHRGECEALLDSTNSVLLARGAPSPGQFDFFTAEHQSAGRGRRGRRWLAPPGGAICLSWSWSFAGLASGLGALSLAVGVAARRALAQCGLHGVMLKWPNDLVTPAGKLGGILIELRSESAGPVQAVVGLGLNVSLGSALRASIDAAGNRATDLAELAGGRPLPGRNALTAALLDAGIEAMVAFERAGFAPFREEFAAADALCGQPVRIRGGHGPDTGIAQGVEADGALRVAAGGTVHRLVAGEVSIRGGTA